MPKPKIDFDVNLNTKKAIEDVATLNPAQFKSFVAAVKDFMKDNEPACGATPRVWKKGNWKGLAAKFVDEHGGDIWADDRAAVSKSHFTLPDDREKIEFISFCLIKFECGTYYKKKRTIDDLANFEVAKEATKVAAKVAAKQATATPAKKQKTEATKRTPSVSASPAPSAYVSEGIVEKTPTPAPDVFRAVKDADAQARARASASVGRASVDPSLSPQKGKKGFDAGFAMPRPSSAKSLQPETPSKLSAVESFRRSAPKASLSVYGAAAEMSHPESPTPRREVAKMEVPNVGGGKAEKVTETPIKSGKKEQANDDDDDNEDGGDDDAEEADNEAEEKEDVDVSMAEPEDLDPADTITLKHPTNPKPQTEAVKNTTKAKASVTSTSKANPSASPAFNFGDDDPFTKSAAGTASGAGSGAGSTRSSAPKTAPITGLNKVVDDTPIPFSAGRLTNGSARRNALTDQPVLTALLAAADRVDDLPPVTANEVRGKETVKSVQPKGTPKTKAETTPKNDPNGNARVSKLAAAATAAAVNGPSGIGNGSFANGSPLSPTSAAGFSSSQHPRRSTTTGDLLPPTATIFFSIVLPTTPAPNNTPPSIPENYLPSAPVSKHNHSSPAHSSSSGTDHEAATHILPLPMNTDFSSFYGQLLLSPSIANDTAAKRRLVSCRVCKVLVPRIGAQRARKWEISVFSLGAERVWGNMLTKVARAVRDAKAVEVEEDLEGLEDGLVEVDLAFEYGLQ